MPDGSEFDGKQLLTLVRGGSSPFHGVWDVNLLIQEIEENLDTQVVDIPQVYNGSNNYASPSVRSSNEVKLNQVTVGVPFRAIESTRCHSSISPRRRQHARL